ncbi:MFS transporter [Kitasatospora sp. GP82]|uniref:MFS transporter n=1 Tax=Kitasatospora sp. GP82 TaxID=3035089 RepID=UPI002474AD6F|nr:MFS transporter [Kitasatospora sp. GP82]MDH6125502.1 putative MFS family arabinose efflux permease [Kitasatospora sp. GP82]
MGSTTPAAPPAQAAAAGRLGTLRTLLCAEVLSMTGSQLSAVALPWFALQSTGSPAAMSRVMAAQMVAVAVFGLLGATLAGRLGPRKVLLFSDTARAPLVALVPLLHAAGLLSMPVFMVLLFAIGSFFAPYVASQQAILPALVGDDETLLSKANARLQGATRLTILLGPPTAGLLIAVMGAPAVLFLDALSFMASALLLRWGLPRDLAIAVAPRRGRLRDSLAVLVKDKLLGRWTVAQILGEGAWQALFALIPVFVLLRHGSSALSGVLLGAFGGGALLGTFLVGPALHRLSNLRLAVLGRVGQGIVFLTLLLPLGPLSLAVFLAVVGLLNGLSNAPMVAVRTAAIPAPLRSSTLTVIAASALSGGTLGLAAVGTAVESAGIARTFMGLAVVQVCGAVLFLLGAAAAPRPRAAAG